MAHKKLIMHLKNLPFAKRLGQFKHLTKEVSRLKKYGKL